MPPSTKTACRRDRHRCRRTRRRRCRVCAGGRAIGMQLRERAILHASLVAIPMAGGGNHACGAVQRGRSAQPNAPGIRGPSKPRAPSAWQRQAGLALPCRAAGWTRISLPDDRGRWRNFILPRNTEDSVVETSPIRLLLYVNESDADQRVYGAARLDRLDFSGPAWMRASRCRAVDQRHVGEWHSAGYCRLDYPACRRGHCLAGTYRLADADRTSII